jgi:hypothetical protein
VSSEWLQDFKPRSSAANCLYSAAIYMYSIFYHVHVLLAGLFHDKPHLFSYFLCTHVT